MSKRIAVCPGSFDPVTNGHLDIIERASAVFDKIIVGVLNNPEKKALFTIDERVEMLEECVSHLDNVCVAAFSGLLVEFVRKSGAVAIIRGLRAISDFEFEFRMASMNRKLAPEIETFFMMTGNEYAYLSSSVVKQVASFGGCVKGLVPVVVEKRLREKFLSRKAEGSAIEE
ncbi:MAG: pantetheine-phosphate adenylyltransferase [Bacillota bacterium]|mgnify:CR=1 FL=1|nr:pantetheine-phosphate adenylyltransferase [Bacillota bacterium]HOB91765.1 pantetheine-phosphate adenylyltransferase [Bacillota bacterium]HPZ55211.1 pantetheine-phosphate adenylyltransferase [Bacillota bacterium]HQD18626.1 pantetheine-phosphate adenylyltransferase [Bacillota bacterium]